MSTDMSPKAVATRLRRASQLRRLCLSLGKAKRLDRDGLAAAASNPKEKGELKSSSHRQKPQVTRGHD